MMQRTSEASLCWRGVALSTIKITFGEPTEFMIIGSNGAQRLLRADSSSPDIS
ncbi:hypothetical protein Gotur_011558, partial [Gossypium turneri]